MDTAIKLVYCKSIIKGKQYLSKSSSVYVDIHESELAINYGYSVADYTVGSTEGDWDLLIG